MLVSENLLGDKNERKRITVEPNSRDSLLQVCGFTVSGYDSCCHADLNVRRPSGSSNDRCVSALAVVPRISSRH